MEGKGKMGETQLGPNLGWWMGRESGPKYLGVEATRS